MRLMFDTSMTLCRFELRRRTEFARELG
jgi:hypothetical protein